GRSWLDTLDRLEADALGQRQELEAASDAWDQAWSRAAHRLHTWLTRLDAILDNYAALLSAEPVPEEVSVRLTRAQREALDLGGAEEAVAWLHRSWPPPSEAVEALFALWDWGLEVGT